MMHNDDRMLKAFQEDFERFCNRIHGWKFSPKDFWAELPEKEKERIKFELMTKQIPKLDGSS